MPHHRPSWNFICEYYGLDTSFQYSPADIEAQYQQYELENKAPVDLAEEIVELRKENADLKLRVEFLQAEQAKGVQAAFQVQVLADDLLLANGIAHRNQVFLDTARNGLTHIRDILVGAGKVGDLSAHNAHLVGIIDKALKGEF